MNEDYHCNIVADFVQAIYYILSMIVNLNV